MKTKDSQLLFAELTKLYDDIKATEQEASILFVDLAGSTAFKSLNGAVLGLQKTFMHNSVVTRVVGVLGEVIKYIGDEVMIVVKGANHPAVACGLAKNIQKEMSNLNRAYQGDPRFPIESKIGIHSGLVQYWKYSGHKQLDPQGTAVDIAARIVSLAKPQQVLCSGETSTQSSLTAKELGPVQERYVKGIRSAIQVCEILWDGQTREIVHNPLPANQDPDVRRLVKEGRERVLAGEFDIGVTRFETALKKAPADFNVNYSLGEVLARRLERVDDAKTYLDKAKTINPGSPALLLLEGFLAWQGFTETRKKDQLEKAIALTEECLKVAEATMDNHNARLAQGNLAYYLAERQEGDDLGRAMDFCENANAMYEKIETRERAGLMDTKALVLLARGGKEDVIEARRLLEEAIKRDPQNHYPHEHMAQVIKKERSLKIKPPRGWNY